MPATRKTTNPPASAKVANKSVGQSAPESDSGLDLDPELKETYN